MQSEGLTSRERQVLDALCGLPFRTQEQIAGDLGISSRTLRSHVSNILAKLGVKDQRQLVIEELNRRSESNGMTMLRRSGHRRLAVIVVETVRAVDITKAIEILSESGDNVFCWSRDVEQVLNGLGE